MKLQNKIWMKCNVTTFHNDEVTYGMFNAIYACKVICAIFLLLTARSTYLTTFQFSFIVISIFRRCLFRFRKYSWREIKWALSALCVVTMAVRQERDYGVLT